MSTYAEKKWGDCSKAVAYELNFVQMCYTSGSQSWLDNYDALCDKCNKISQKKISHILKNLFLKKITTF